jgi:predicted transcriptional regulator
MKIIDHFERLKKMNRMIKSCRTGTPGELAEMLGISQSHLFRCLDELSQFGLVVRYSRSMKTYYYEDDYELSIHYSVKLISTENAKEIMGGGKSLAFLEQLASKEYDWSEKM